MHMGSVRRVAQDWKDVSFALKRDPEADAEFGWMLEMWGYSIACGRQGVRHQLLDALQIEPSSQFGTVITRRDGAGEGATRVPTHYIYHYTFSHEYTLEGVPQLDSRNGEWSYDKRNFQKYLPLDLLPPPRCALEAAHRLYEDLHSASAALAKSEVGGPWHSAPPEATKADVARHAKTVRPGVDALAAQPAALALVGSGPWLWRAASESTGPFFFLRGGFMSTPWGSARWAANTAREPLPSGGAPLTPFAHLQPPPSRPPPALRDSPARPTPPLPYPLPTTRGARSDAAARRVPLRRGEVDARRRAARARRGRDWSRRRGGVAARDGALDRRGAGGAARHAARRAAARRRGRRRQRRRGRRGGGAARARRAAAGAGAGARRWRRGGAAPAAARDGSVADAGRGRGLSAARRPRVPDRRPPAAGRVEGARADRGRRRGGGGGGGGGRRARGRARGLL